MAKAFILASNASTEFEDYKGKKLTVFIPSDAAFTAAGLNETSVQTLATTEEGMKVGDTACTAAGCTRGLAAKAEAPGTESTAIHTAG
jgi:hypothetical protein